MPTHSQTEAQQRADRIDSFRAELTALEQMQVAVLPEETRRAIEGYHARLLIARGLIEPVVTTDKNKRRVTGRITRLLVERIHVPLEHRPVLEAVAANGASDLQKTGPRYQVDLAVGRRFEPWIVAVDRVEGKH